MHQFSASGPSMHRHMQERVEEGEIDPHTPLFINITYTKKRPSFRQNSWCAKGRMLPWLGVLIKQYCRRFIPPSLYSLLILFVANDHCPTVHCTLVTAFRPDREKPACLFIVPRTICGSVHVKLSN